MLKPLLRSTTRAPPARVAASTTPAPPQPRATATISHSLSRIALTHEGNGGWQTPGSSAQAAPAQAPAAQPSQQQPQAPVLRPPVELAADPVATLESAPEAVQTLSYAIRFPLARFNLRAAVRPSPGATSFAGWEVGIAQMVSGIVDTRCYHDPSPRSGLPPYFIDSFVNPMGLLIPDRATGTGSTSDLFVEPAASVDLERVAASTGGAFTVPLSATDNPNVGVSRLSAAGITHDMADENRSLSLIRRAGYFYTFVTARHRPTGTIVPLHVAIWHLGVEYRVNYPGPGTPPSLRRTLNVVRLNENRPWTPSHIAPSAGGTPINTLTMPDSPSRVRSRGNDCPGFIAT